MHMEEGWEGWQSRVPPTTDLCSQQPSTQACTGPCIPRKGLSVPIHPAPWSPTLQPLHVWALKKPRDQ